MNVNQVSNNIFNSKQFSNMTNMNKNEFLNMLQMVMAENTSNTAGNIDNQALSSDSVKSNIMDLLWGSNFNNFVVLNNQNVVDINEINKDINDIDKDTNINEKEINYENLVALADIYNFSEPIILNSEISEDAVQKDIYNTANAGISKESEFKNSNKLYQDKQTTDLINEEVVKSKEVPVIKSTAPISASAEKLISVIEGNRNKLKNEINYNAELLAGNKSLVENQNKIITISDESNEIKSQVLSQVEDKIVFMTKEGSDSNTVKEVTMELQPHNLGKVHIKMNFENDKITVEIKALNEETQKILASNAEELVNVLSKTTDAAVNIIVKPNEFSQGHQEILFNQNNEQSSGHNLNQDNDQNYQQGRQKNQYYYEDRNESEEDSIFSELINLRNFKLNM